jgi:hypothetical protein
MTSLPASLEFKVRWKLVLGMMMALFGSAAFGGWESVGESDVAELYVDKTTIRRAGPIARMWSLLEYRETQTQDGFEPFRSSRSQAEYDCQDERARTVYLTNHSGSMAGGNTVYTSTRPFDWIPVPPRTLREAAWKVACGKK